MNSLKKWLSAATPKEKSKLAKLAKTSISYLRHLANGRRKITAEQAARIESATQKIEKVPNVLRGEISPTCAACPYYKSQCEGKIK